MKIIQQKWKFIVLNNQSLHVEKWNLFEQQDSGFYDRFVSYEAYALSWLHKIFSLYSAEPWRYQLGKESLLHIGRLESNFITLCNLSSMINLLTKYILWWVAEKKKKEEEDRKIEVFIMRKSFFFI